MKKSLYPGVREAEEERVRAELSKRYGNDEEPDMINGSPNYDKFTGWDVEKVLVFLNID